MTEREAIEQALNTKFEGAVRNIRFLTLPGGKAAAVASVYLPWAGDWRPLSFTYTAGVGLEVWVIGGEGGNVPGGFQVFEYEDLWKALKHNLGSDFLNLLQGD